MKKKIYIADLTHTASGLTSITFPLGTALVTSYAKHICNDSFEFRIFKFHDQLTRAISENPPSILALSNYTWNLEISSKLSAWAKRQNPNLIVIFGVPNFVCVYQLFRIVIFPKGKLTFVGPPDFLISYKFHICCISH